MKHFIQNLPPKLLAVAIAFVLVGFGSAVLTVYAAQQSLPGDALYPIKSGLESVQQAVLGTTSLQGQLIAPAVNDNSNVNVNDNLNVNDNVNVNVNENVNNNTNENVNVNSNENTNEDLNANGNESDKEEQSLEGTVDQINASQIVVNGMSFTINLDTKLDGNILVGDKVEVEYVPDGTPAPVALKVELEESKTGDEDNNETTLTNTNANENSQSIEPSEDDHSSINSNVNTNGEDSDEHHSGNVNSNQNDSHDNENEGHD